MQQTVNIPIQLISSCSTQGTITPMRFRYESDDHELITVDVRTVSACKETHYIGISEYIYVCSALFNNMEKTFELKYNVPNHKWTLFQMLS